MRIAMWSGPRNLSTAMMYSFGARRDFAVVDEPFYAAYLIRSGLNHPMRNEIIASQSTDPQEVAAMLTGPVPKGREHFYQKHMTQHMIAGIPRDWMEGIRHVFLIRHPARVVASFGAKYDKPTLADIGFTQQTELFEQLSVQGVSPIVVDSADIRRDPEGMLTRLCAALNLPFDPAMLQWPAGGHKSDGVWAPHWYGAAHSSTKFAPAEGQPPDLTGEAGELVTQALPHYRLLEAHKL